MAEGPKRPASGPETTAPLWQPPGAASRSRPVTPALGPAALAKTQPVGATAERETVTAEQPVVPLPLERTSPSSPPGAAAPSDPLRPSLHEGDLIGDRYVIAQRISSGSFGAVFRATDRQIPNHQVALKLLHKPSASEAEREAALRELTLIASVSHPSVVQFKDYGWMEGRLWFAMPWYEGQTLDRRFPSESPLTRAEARPIFERLALGLAAMHEVGIHHHDIKPENVFLADVAGFEGGLPVLLDLGIASKRGEGPKGLTPEYAAPEVAAAVLGDKKPIGSAADVFSLALVLRNLLEPETAPSTAGDIVALLNARATQPAPRFSRRELRYLQPTFDRCLSLDPTERPSASELATLCALLTAPEERRQARMRLLSRIVPVVLFAALIVAVLFLQVQKQETEITVQREQLSEARKKSAELRAAQTDQLKQLETQNQQLGTQGERLTQAIGIARSLDEQLDRAEAEGEALRARLKKLGEERAALEKASEALRGERDGLAADKQNLTRERAELSAARDGLVAERDRLLLQRDQLSAQHKAVEEERDALIVKRGELERAREESQNERDALSRKLQAADDELATVRKAYDELRDEVKTLREKLRTARRARDGRAAASAETTGDVEPAPAP